jgi:hypothetical protein
VLFGCVVWLRCLVVLFGCVVWLRCCVVGCVGGCVVVAGCVAGGSSCLIMLLFLASPYIVGSSSMVNLRS